MCQLIETIKAKNCRLPNLELHNARVNYSRKYLFGAADNWNLSELITLPVLDPLLVYKCRFVYAQAVAQIEFLPYTARLINRLKLVYADDLDYSFKYADRSSLDQLKKKHAIQPQTDILIVKAGSVTDTSFSNIAFFDGSEWFTPDTPLLKGTKRAFYINNNLIKERKITSSDLGNFQKARLINAMLDLETGTDIAICDIV